MMTEGQSGPKQALSRISQRAQHDRRRVRLLVGAGSCGLASGADIIVQSLREAASSLDAPVEIVVSGCTGMCFEAVQVTLQRPGQPDVTWSSITPEQATPLVEIAAQPRELTDLPPSLIWQQKSFDGVAGIGDTPFLARQRRVLFENIGCVDPVALSDALDRGAYGGLAAALSMTQDEVLQEIVASEIGGRGGAYFPVGRKLTACREMPGPDRCLVVNAEEGEPGVFKDRHLLEGDPHRVIEGALIAAWSMGANEIFFYVNGQARLSIERLDRALNELREHGLLAGNILDSKFQCDIEIREGAGGYVLGEESALLESVEGNRSMPRVRPPFPFQSGLWKRPTAVQNVESVANLPSILDRGSEWFRQLGIATGMGTKLICLSGAVERSGVVEVEIGATLRTLLLEIAGGPPNGATLQAVLTGGPSGFLVPPSLFDTPLEPRMSDILLGSGNLVAVDDSVSLFDLVRRLTHFNAEESCGKCTPCRDGVNQLADILDRVAEGNASESDLADIELLCDVASAASLCGLGQMAPNPVRSLLTHFPVPELGHTPKEATDGTVA
jgi:NADH:ubiquinone oxidoreductase subunit F (NADH-binding)